MKLSTIFLLVSIIAFYSCNKDLPADPPQDQDPIFNNYYPMSIGNYWVYEYITKDPNGTIIGSPSYDTTKIIGDTLIDSQSYYILSLNKPMNNTRITLRDSSGYIINQNGKINLLPSANEAIYNFHFGYIGNDTAYAYWEEFHDALSIETPAGNYTCLGKIAKHELWPTFGSTTSVDSNLFANIGQVQRSYSYMSGAKVIGTLIEYHLE